MCGRVLESQTNVNNCCCCCSPSECTTQRGGVVGVAAEEGASKNSGLKLYRK